MVGATAQGLLSPTTFRCDFATVADEPALRALLRGVPMEGRIRLTLEREPARSLLGPRSSRASIHTTIFHI